MLKSGNRRRFKEHIVDTGMTLWIARPENDANYVDSMKMLEDAGLRPLTYQEALCLLVKDDKLKNSLKDEWLWLAGQGIDKGGKFTVAEEGELAEREGPSAETTVFVWSGGQPLMLLVHSDIRAAYLGRRFLLDGGAMSDYLSSVVLGVPKDSPSLVEVRKIQTQLESLIRKQEPQTGMIQRRWMVREEEVNDNA